MAAINAIYAAPLSRMISLHMAAKRESAHLTPKQNAVRLPAAFYNALDNSFSDINIQLAGGVVVQEEQRLGSGRNYVIDAHGHQVNANCVMLAKLKRQLELGPNTISPGHQKRITCAIQA